MNYWHNISKKRDKLNVNYSLQRFLIATLQGGLGTEYETIPEVRNGKNRVKRYHSTIQLNCSVTLVHVCWYANAPWGSAVVSQMAVITSDLRSAIVEVKSLLVVRNSWTSYLALIGQLNIQALITVFFFSFLVNVNLLILHYIYFEFILDPLGFTSILQFCNMTRDGFWNIKILAVFE